MSDMQPIATGAEFNAVVYQRGKLHVRLERWSIDSVLCGRRITDQWDSVSGWLWNTRPDARCANCDCLGRGAVLKA